jgi:guanine deaminase
MLVLQVAHLQSYIYQEIALPIEKRNKTMMRLLGTEAIEAFRMWERNDKKTEY